MNQFSRASIAAINRSGISVTYKAVTNGTYDPSTGVVTSPEVSTTLKTYPKQIQFTTFNHPDLIGKEGILFYFSGESFNPKLSDVVVYNSSDYIVQSIQSHFAQGQVVLYRILTIKG